MIKTIGLISIFLFLSGSFSVSAENSSLVYGQKDIFWSSNYKKNKINNDDLLTSRYRLLPYGVDAKVNVRPAVKINTLFNNKVTDIVFDSIPLEWDLLMQGNESWMVSSNNKLISKSNSIALHKPLLISIQKPSFKDKWTLIRDYDELQVNYKAASNKQSCSVSASLDFKGQSWNSKKGLLTLKEKWVATYDDNQSMTETNLSDARAEKWTQKSFDYFISRKFNRKPDGIWRYTKDGKNVVVQRRMHWPINKSSLLTIKHSKEMNIVGASVSVSFEDEYGSGNLLTLEVPLSEILPDGSFRSEFDVGSVIASNYRKLMDDRQLNANKQQAYIQEIFLHVESDVESFMLDKPLISVSLMSPDTLFNKGLGNLTKNIGVRASEFGWKEEDFSNLLSQFFSDTKDSNAWYWQEGSNNTKIEKKLNWVFKPKSKLAVYVAPNTEINSISVQFGTEGGVGREVTVFDPVLVMLPNAKNGILLDLDGLVVDHLLDTMNASGEIVQPILESIKISIGGNAKKVVGERQLQEITLFESKIGTSNKSDMGFTVNNHYYDFNTHIEKIGSGRERKVFDLSKLVKEAQEMVLETGVLSISVPPKEDNCQIEIESINLVSSYKTKEKIYISNIKSLNQKYGGRFLPDSAQRGYVEGLEFLAYSSPVLLYSANDRHEKITNIPVNSVGDVMVDNITTTTTTTTTTDVVTMIGNHSEGFNITKGDWVSTDGLKFTADGQIISAEQSFLENGSSEVGTWKGAGNNEGNGQNSLQGVRIRGVSKNLTLSWPVKVKGSHESFFFLSIPEGFDQIAKIKLEVGGEDGEQWVGNIKANQPISLVDVPDDIDNIVVKIDFIDQEFDIVFSDVLIATPKIMKHSEALVEGAPWKGVQLLNQGELSKGIVLLNDSLEENFSYWPEGVVKGSLEMIVPNPSQWFESMGVKYQIPNEWLGIDGCIVEGEFVFANKTLSRSFCLGQSSGSQSFTVSDLGMLDQEKLEKIIWHVTKPKGKSGVVTFSTWVNTRGLSSIYNQIKQLPLLHLGGKPYYLDDANLQDIVNNNHSFWTKLPTEFLTDYLKNTRLLTLNNENPWLEVERIAVEPKDNMSLKKWLAFIKPIEFERSFNWFKLVSFLFLFVGIVAIVRKGWWPSIRSSIAGLIKMSLWQLPKIIITQSWAVGVYTSRWMNVILGVLIVPLLIWLAGNSKDVYVTTALLFSAVMFGIGVYRHYTQFGVAAGKINKVKWTELAWGLVIVSVMWLTLLVGANNKMQWYFIMPLLSSFYGVFPEVVRIARGVCKSSKALFETIIWGGVAFILYVSGSINWSNMGENYYFTFGGMAIVLMWRALTEYIKPIIHSKYPTIAQKIYGGAGTQYFSGFIVILVGAALMLMLKLEPIAEQLAIIGYYMLVVGVVLEMLVLRKDKSESYKKDSLDT